MRHESDLRAVCAEPSLRRRGGRNMVPKERWVGTAIALGLTVLIGACGAGGGASNVVAPPSIDPGTAIADPCAVQGASCDAVRPREQQVEGFPPSLPRPAGRAPTGRSDAVTIALAASSAPASTTVRSAVMSYGEYTGRMRLGSNLTVSPERAVWVVTVAHPLATRGAPGRPGGSVPLYTVVIDVASASRSRSWETMTSFNRSRSRGCPGRGAELAVRQPGGEAGPPAANEASEGAEAEGATGEGGCREYGWG